MITSIFIAACIGFGISLYTYLLENKVKRMPSYKPFCDISDKISCTKPMKSEYSSLFYFSNALVGMLFYAVIAVLAFFDAGQMLLAALILGCVVSCIFAYLLFFRIKSLCLLCSSLYIINVVMLYLYYAHGLRMS